MLWVDVSASCHDPYAFFFRAGVSEEALERSQKVMERIQKRSNARSADELVEKVLELPAVSGGMREGDWTPTPLFSDLCPSSFFFFSLDEGSRSSLNSLLQTPGRALF